jgi:hypothetical protein
VSQTVRRKGLEGPRLGDFPKPLLSRIIYVTLDSRPRIEMDRRMHLRNNQLGKVVSPLGCDGHQSSKLI